MSTPLQSTTGFICKSTMIYNSPEESARVIIAETRNYEEIDVLEKRSSWSLINTKSDNISGWVTSSSYSPYQNQFKANAYIQSVCAHLFPSAEESDSFLDSLPFETQIMVLSDVDSQWSYVQNVDGKTGYMLKKNFATSTKVSVAKISDLAIRFLGKPTSEYGRSSISGYNSLSFITLLLRSSGCRNIPSTMNDLMSWKEFVSPRVQEIYGEGNIIFFGKQDENKIDVLHVALSIGDKKCIHASPAKSQNIQTDTIQDVCNSFPECNFWTAKRLKGG